MAAMVKKEKCPVIKFERCILQQGVLSSDSIYAIMSEEKANQSERISFKVQDLRGFFTKNYTAKQMTDTILKLLYDNQCKLERRRNSREER
jgi:ParB family chromosome partitioning protein